MVELSDRVDKTEEIRLREVRTGHYYDCPRKFYAEKVILNGIDWCKGNNVGLNGHIAMVCETCPVYHR